MKYQTSIVRDIRRKRKIQMVLGGVTAYLMVMVSLRTILDECNGFVMWRGC